VSPYYVQTALSPLSVVDRRPFNYNCNYGYGNTGNDTVVLSKIASGDERDRDTLTAYSNHTQSQTRHVRHWRHTRTYTRVAESRRFRTVDKGLQCIEWWMEMNATVSE
jgi:hypothetical protein